MTDEYVEFPDSDGNWVRRPRGPADDRLDGMKAAMDRQLGTVTSKKWTATFTRFTVLTFKNS